MSIKTTHQQRLDYLVTLTYNLGKEMSAQKWRIASDFVATLILGAIALLALNKARGAIVGLTVFAIMMVNTVTLSDLARAVRETKSETREQLVEDE